MPRSLPVPSPVPHTPPHPRSRPARRTAAAALACLALAGTAATPAGATSRPATTPVVTAPDATRLDRGPHGPYGPRADQGWRPPLRGVEVLRPFDGPVHRFGAGHRGVDLAAPPGTPVLAPAAGVVRFAGVVAGRGVLSLAHRQGLTTTYEPVRALVSAGQHVVAGQTLGHVTGTGGHCGPPWCLHWGALSGPDRYLDPLVLLAGPVRLLPLRPGWSPGAPGRR